jgi:hypothetical protein
MRSLRLAAAAALVAAVAVPTPASADGGRALIEIGRLSDGSPTGVDPAGLVAGLTVDQGSGGDFGVDTPPRFETRTLTYTPPPDTTITASEADATSLRAYGWVALGTWTELRTSWGDWNILGDPGEVDRPATLFGGPAATLTASVSQTSTGAGAEQPGWFLLRRLAVELSDGADPELTATPAAGALLGAPEPSGWYTSASLPVTVTAGDRGLGVRRLVLRDALGGVRRIALPGLPASCATKNPATTSYGGDTYTSSVPCPTASAQYVVPVDLTTLGDGQYTLQLGVMDASGRIRYAPTTYAVKVNAPGLNPPPGGGPGLSDPGESCSNGTYDDAGICVVRAPSNDVVPSLSGTPSVGGSLTTDLGTWSDAAGATWTYGWQLCDAGGSGCSAIPSEHGPTLALTAAMADHTVRSLVTATTGAGSADARSAPSYPIAAAGAGGAGGAGGIRDVSAPPSIGGGLAGAGGGPFRVAVDDAIGLPVPVSVTVHRVNGRGGERTARVSASLRGAAIAGRLTSSAGEPIADAQIDVLAQRAVRGAHGEVAGAAMTDADGRFLFTPPPSAARRIYTFGYREHLSDDAYAHFVSVTVTPAPTLTVDHPTRLNGQIVVFRGTGDDPVELQVRIARRWKTIASPPLRDGAFIYRYRFTRTRTRHTYRFRVLTDSGPSAPVTVRVAPKVEVGR